MEFKVIIEFTPSNDHLKRVILENFSQLDEGSPDQYQKQAKALSNAFGNHFFFEHVFFWYSEITLVLKPTEVDANIRLEAVVDEEEDNIGDFIIKFGTMLLDSDSELVAIKAIGDQITQVGYVDGEMVEVCDETELEDVLAEINREWVDDKKYEGLDDIFKGISGHANVFGFKDKLHFFIYNEEPELALEPVDKDPAHWAGAISYFNRKTETWVKDLSFEVFVENIVGESNRIIHFNCGDTKFSGPPALCIVPDKNGALKSYQIRPVRVGSYMMDEEIDKILEDAFE